MTGNELAAPIILILSILLWVLVWMMKRSEMVEKRKKQPKVFQNYTDKYYINAQKIGRSKCVSLSYGYSSRDREIE